MESIQIIRDVRLIFHQAWSLQTEEANYTEAAALYIEALKLNPQRARQLSTSMWSEAWGLQNIRGYPSRSREGQGAHFLSELSKKIVAQDLSRREGH